MGVNYHLGIGTTSAGQASNDRIYGYNLVPDPRLGTFKQQTDLGAKNKLISYSSELLIDRDFVNWPRVTDGDFSGGALQQVFIDTTRYFDADLDVRVPGILAVNPAWQRTATLVGSLGGVTPQSVAWNDSIYTTFGGANIFKQDGTTIASSGITNKFIDTDGFNLFSSDGVNNIKYTVDGVTWTVLTNASGTVLQMWIINLGTTGRFLYWTTPTSGYNQVSTVKKTDNQVFSAALVPLGSNNINVVDMVTYLNGIAFVSKDSTGSAGFDVWFHDGQNMSRIIRINGFYPTGMCTCLGQIYVTAQGSSGTDAPALFKISSGSFEIVSRVAPPLVSQSVASTIGAPISTGQYVYFGVHNPQVVGISAVDYVGVFDTLKGAYWHFGVLDANDVPPVAGPRQIATSGRAVGFPSIIAGNGTLQYTVNGNKLVDSGSPPPIYAPGGWLFSSRIDFNTPGISKMFRRVLVHHAPLNAGESIGVSGYIDVLPTSVTTATTATATKTNSAAGTTVTVLTFPSNTQGHSLVVGLRLISGTNQQTTPQVYYFATEISTPWGFEFTVDCSTKRRTLQQQDDPQGLLGKDLYYLLANAWANGLTVTLYLSSGENFVCTIEHLEFFNPSPQAGQATPLKANDYEAWATLVLRQSSAA